MNCVLWMQTQIVDIMFVFSVFFIRWKCVFYSIFLSKLFAASNNKTVITSYTFAFTTLCSSFGDINEILVNTLQVLRIEFKIFLDVMVLYQSTKVPKYQSTKVLWYFTKVPKYQSVMVLCQRHFSTGHFPRDNFLSGNFPNI